MDTQRSPFRAHPGEAPASSFAASAGPVRVSAHGVLGTESDHVGHAAAASGSPGRPHNRNAQAGSAAGSAARGHVRPAGPGGVSPAVSRVRALTHDEEAAASNDALSAALGLFTGLFRRGEERSSAPGCPKLAPALPGSPPHAAPGGKGTTVVAACSDGSMHVWRLGIAQIERSFAAHTAAVCALCALPGWRCVSASEDRTLAVWHVKSGERECRLEGHLGAVRAVAALADGRVLSGGDDRTVCVWDVPSASVQRTMEGHEDGVSALIALGCGASSFPQSVRALSSSWDGTLRVWDCDTGRCQLVLVAHAGGATCVVSLSSDGARAASGGADGLVRVWHLHSGTCELSLERHQGDVTALAALTNGHLASAGTDGVVHLWSLADGSCAALVSAGGTTCPSISALLSLKDGRLVAAAGASLRVWREPAAEGEPAVVMEGHRAVSCLAFLEAPSKAGQGKGSSRNLCGFDRIC